jgi:RNA polymerase sigma factor (sigma-70 family)
VQRILRDHHDADDAFQATFLVLVRKVAGLGDPELLGNWLYGVAYRAALKIKRAKATRFFKERQVMSRRAQESSDPLVSQELLECLDHELVKLPEKFRAPIVFCDLEGMTRTAAARKLGCPLGTLNWRLAEARAMLAKRLTRRGLGLGAAALAVVFQQSATAAVPMTLMSTTVKIGSLMAAGQTIPAGMMSAQVAALTKGVMMSMFFGKFKMATGILVLIGVLGIGAGGVRYRAVAAGPGEKNGVALQESKSSAPVKGEIQLGSFGISASNFIFDSKNNTANVKGPGVLTFLSGNNLKGETLSEPKKITIRWKDNMFFDGENAEFCGEVRASQGDGFLKCENLYLKIDGLSPFKKQQGEKQVAKIESLTCDRSVSFQNDTKDKEGKRVHFERSTAYQLNVKPLAGRTIATGPGKVETLLRDGIQLHINQDDAKVKNGMKATRIFFEERMFSNNTDNTPIVPNVENNGFPALAFDGATYSNQRKIRVPINFKDSLRDSLRHLLLFASWDQGRTYDQAAKVAPDKNEFIFEATQDGTCWLKVAVIDRQGKQIPEEIQKGKPDRKIIIDTMKPVIRSFTAKRQGTDVWVDWEIIEDNFDSKGFRLEYKTDQESSFWTAIDARPGLRGKIFFEPASKGPLSLRLTARDLADNVTDAHWQLAALGDRQTSGNSSADWKKNLTPEEARLFRKSQFEAADRLFSENKLLEAMARYQELQDLYRQKVEGLIAFQRIFKCSQNIVSPPQQVNKARLATREAAEKAGDDIKKMPENSEAFRGEGVWSKKQWQQYIIWTADYLNPHMNPPPPDKWEAAEKPSGKPLQFSFKLCEGDPLGSEAKNSIVVLSKLDAVSLPDQEFKLDKSAALPRHGKFDLSIKGKPHGTMAGTLILKLEVELSTEGDSTVEPVKVDDPSRLNVHSIQTRYNLRFSRS